MKTKIIIIGIAAATLTFGNCINRGFIPFPRLCYPPLHQHRGGLHGYYHPRHEGGLHLHHNFFRR